MQQANFAAADLRGVLLEPEYSYDVYYDNQTYFDANFHPTQESLSEKQEYIFKTQVWDRFVLEQCDDCGNKIYSYCDHKYCKIMAE